MRHRYVNEQLEEAHLLIHKLFEHKDKFKSVLIETAVSNSTTPNTTSNTSHETTCEETSNHQLQQHQSGLYSCQEQVNGGANVEASSMTVDENGVGKASKQHSSLRRNLKKSMNTRNTLAKSKRPS